MIHLAFHNGRAEVMPRLHIGGAPYQWDGGSAFDVVVLCAAEYQVELDRLGQAIVIRCPFEDKIEPLPEEVKAKIEATAEEVYRRWQAGDTVAVACMAGRNRSGLVLAKVLMLHGFLPLRAIEMIRKCRPSALTNGAFNEWILSC